MQLPLQVVFRNVEPSDFIRADIEAQAAKLEQFFDRIVSCRVTVEAITRRGQKGKLFSVRVDVGVPGREIVTHGAGFKSHTHEDVHAAIRSAFTAAARSLEDHARKMRGDVKTPSIPPKAIRPKKEAVEREAE